MPVRENHSPQLLFVDDEKDFQRFIEQGLTPAGYDVVITNHWEEAKSLLESREIEPKIIFIEPWSGTGMDLENLRDFQTGMERIPIVVISTQRNPSVIVQAIQRGARDYIVKPLGVEKLRQTIHRVLNGSPAEKSVGHSHKALEPPRTEFIYCDPKMKRIHETILQIAGSTVPVLIQGESGVGKEVVARLIHEHSGLRRKNLVKVNCAALPAELTESELFGHSRGAFTGAHIDRPGKFEFAHKGTIFLDEIGEFPAVTQAKLLQVLQDGRFTRLGSNEEVEVNVRVVAATNRDLDKAVEDRQFRADLYYRINVVNIEVPPLRERKAEILLLCDYFLKKHSRQYRLAGEELPRELVDCFQNYNWPGNVRELENLLKRYLVLQDPEGIRSELEKKVSCQIFEGIEEVADAHLEKCGNSVNLKDVAKKAAARVEKSMIFNALRQNNWNKSRAAKELKVSYKTLLTKIEEYKIRPAQL
ncbi:MAG: sigma-54-dependent transcriptional regulator [Acidobacteriota bacterium]